MQEGISKMFLSLSHTHAHTHTHTQNTHTYTHLLSNVSLACSQMSDAFLICMMNFLLTRADTHTHTHTHTHRTPETWALITDDGSIRFILNTRWEMSKWIIPHRWMIDKRFCCVHCQEIIFIIANGLMNFQGFISLQMIWHHSVFLKGTASNSEGKNVWMCVNCCDAEAPGVF